jgi:hypothetical protein
MGEHDGRDPRYQQESPHGAREQAQPEPERPVPETEKLRGGQSEKPSQAEGERSDVR